MVHSVTIAKESNVTHTLDAFEVFPYEWDVWRNSTYVGTFNDSTFGDMIADCMRQGINIVISNPTEEHDG
jgi:hypothetical protein